MKTWCAIFQHLQLELVAAYFADIPLRLGPRSQLIQPGDVFADRKTRTALLPMDGVPVLTSHGNTTNGQYALRVEHLINPI